MTPRRVCYLVVAAWVGCMAVGGVLLYLLQASLILTAAVCVVVGPALLFFAYLHFVNRAAVDPSGAILYEESKIPGVAYAVCEIESEGMEVSGMELAVVDITNPAFSETHRGLNSDWNKVLTYTGIRIGIMMKIFPMCFMRYLSRRSLIVSGVFGSTDGAFNTALATYFGKLGPKFVGSFRMIDRYSAHFVMSHSHRHRLCTMVDMALSKLLPELQEDRSNKTLHYISIGGGSCITSLNVFLSLVSDGRRSLLEGRRIVLTVLDIDTYAPMHLGKKFYAAMMDVDQPLHGLNIELNFLEFNWSDIDAFQGKLYSSVPENEGAIRLMVSEGGLFVYGTDTDISNVCEKVLEIPSLKCILGSVGPTTNPLKDLIMHVSDKVGGSWVNRDLSDVLDLCPGWKFAIEDESQPFEHMFCLEKCRC